MSYLENNGLYQTREHTSVKLYEVFPGDTYSDVWGDRWNIDPYTREATREAIRQDTFNEVLNELSRG